LCRSRRKDACPHLRASFSGRDPRFSAWSRAPASDRRKEQALAFLDFAQALAGPQMAVGATRPTPAVPAISVEAQATSFSAQEWQIVDLARTDGLRSLRGPGSFARLRKWIWGEEHSPTLASERLEALRRLAVEAWHKGYAVSLSALAAFRAAGFSTAQLELLLATISAGRTARAPRS
jgi:hypothetical protein